MRRFDFQLLAAYQQFHLQDESANANLGESFWTDAAVGRLLAVAPGAIGVSTARDSFVPVGVEVHDTEPEPDLEPWDHVTECSLEIPTGRVVIMGCTEAFPEAARIEVPPAVYRARISYGALDTVSENRREGDDRYLVQLWRAPAIEPRVLKQRDA
jgi:hypothetical protein